MLPVKGRIWRKLCISREGIVGSDRVFPLRETFEAMAVERGYEIIRPENISIIDQAKVFSEASIIIGEHGSTMHNAVFSCAGTVVG